MEDEGSQEVTLHIYDLTQGMAAMMSQMLLGRYIEGVWHTGVVAFGMEYFFGGQGIQCCPPGGTILGCPGKKEIIGKTFIPYQVFKDYIRGLADSTFRGSRYNLLQHNCNTFSQELCQFLCGTGIPRFILDLPQEILSTPLGQAIGPLIERIGSPGDGMNNLSLEPQVTARENSPEFEDLNNEIEEARRQSLVLEERRQIVREKIDRKEKKKHSNLQHSESVNEYNSNSGMTEVQQGANEFSEIIEPEMLPSERLLEDESIELAEEEDRRKNREPPLVYRDIDPKVELEAFGTFIDGKLTKEEKVNIEELHQYLIQGEGSWALGDKFLVFIGRILRDPSILPEIRVHLIRALAVAALKDDVILILHQDRRDHVLMNFSQDFDRASIEEQKAWALFMCNLFENLSASEWLLYISEWTYNKLKISNIRGTVKVATHCLLAPCNTLQDIGTSIIYNLAIKEVKAVVFDDVAVELTLAILQFLSRKPSEEHLFRTLKALAKLILISSDVPQFIQMIGPQPKTFKGSSLRVDVVIEEILKAFHQI